MAFKEIRRSEMERSRRAPNLFPEAKHYVNPGELAEYISERLVELAKAKQLMVTDLMQQPRRVMDAAGMIILGQRWVNAGISEWKCEVNPPEVTPTEVESYQVKLKSRKCSVGEKELKREVTHTVQWSKGKQPVRTRRWTYTGDASSMDAKVELLEDVTVDTEQYEIDLPIRYAWLALRQHGAHCKKAITETEREREWWFEEVPPPGYQPESLMPSEAKKRGRTRVEVSA